MDAGGQDSLKWWMSLWIFCRGFAQALIRYAAEKSKETTQPSSPVRGIGLTEDSRLPEKLPSAVDIKRALPKNVFKSSVRTSLYYMGKDIIIAVLLYAALIHLEVVTPYWLLPVVYLLYWATQGTMFTAFFVIGHDCGHESFSEYPLLNDIVGTIMHAFLCVPYYGWKLSHRHHHKNTNNIDREEVYYPVRESQMRREQRDLLPGFGLGVGFFGYLVYGYKPRPVHHYNPWQPMFQRHLLGCVLSIVALGFWAVCLYQYTISHGLWAIFAHFLVPVFIFASYAVIITFLHHHENTIPWYGDDKWDFVRGQLSTIDRHYGLVHGIIHNIGTHQMHHMFTKIPHYHLEEATKHFRHAFPDLVRECDEPIWPSFWRMFSKYAKQSIIRDDTQIHVYK